MHLMVLAHVPMVTSRSHLHSAEASGRCMCAAVQRGACSKGHGKYGQVSKNPKRPRSGC